MRFRIRHAITLMTVLAVLWVVQLSVVYFKHMPLPIESVFDVKKPIGVDLERFNVPLQKKPDSDGIGAIPVFVVEEHHEVLRYWFGSADKGLLPKEGNTVFHIDGHSDGAVPTILDIIPHFRRPKSRNEVYNMMQRNDVFVAAAALGRLINRFIWVWPAWDKKNHDLDYELFDIEAGFMKKNDSLLCGCGAMRMNTTINGCYQHDSTSDEFFTYAINRTECDLTFSGVVEEISEKRAIELLNGGSWLTDKDHVILDIDEDYYGCETVLQTLNNVNISVDMTVLLTNRIQYLLCPMTRSVTEEMEADAFFHSLIEVIINVKSKCEESNYNRSCRTQDVENALIRMIPDILDNIYESHARMLLCNEKNDRMNGLMIQILLKFLIKLTIPQLKVLEDIGVCLETAVEPFIESSMGLHVCHGSNLPNETIVLYHSPTPKEVQERSRILHELLHSGSFNPKIVTICRSVRDDYTPRSHFHKIETDILRILHESFSDVHWATVYYDKHLLGGKRGWPGRHH